MLWAWGNFLKFKKLPIFINAYLPHHTVSEHCEWPLTSNTLPFCAVFVYRKQRDREKVGQCFGSAPGDVNRFPNVWLWWCSRKRMAGGAPRQCECGSLGGAHESEHEGCGCWWVTSFPLSSSFTLMWLSRKIHAQSLCLSLDKGPQKSLTLWVKLHVCVISGDSADSAE